MPHAYYTLGSAIGSNDHVKLSFLLHQYGQCLLYDGRYNETDVLSKKAIDIDRAHLGVDHPNTLTSISQLAMTYMELGRLEEAEELQVQVLEAC